MESPGNNNSSNIHALFGVSVVGTFQIHLTVKTSTKLHLVEKCPIIAIDDIGNKRFLHPTTNRFIPAGEGMAI
jgi:hypothetical protein